MPAEEIISRTDARARGLRWFFTGVPCINGHVSKRSVPRGACVRCAYEWSKKWLEGHPGKKKEYHEKWRDRHWDQYYQKNIDRIRAYEEGRKEVKKEYMKEWQKKNRERLKEERADYLKAWHEDNKERRRAAAAQRYIENRDIELERSRLYMKANPEVGRTRTRNYRARKIAAEGMHSAQTEKELRERQKDRCAYCRTKLHGRGHVDHIVPLARGGSNWPRNLQLTCPECNARKGAKHPTSFARENGLLL